MLANRVYDLCREKAYCLGYLNRKLVSKATSIIDHSAEIYICSLEDGSSFCSEFI